MNKLFQKYQYVFLIVILSLVLSSAPSLFAQHQGHDMQGKKAVQPSPSPTPLITHTGGNAPGPAPAGEQKMDMDMPQPSPSPTPVMTHKHGNEPAAMGNMDMGTPAKAQPAGNSMKGMDSAAGTSSMNMGPLLVMSGNDLGVRVGASEKNVTSMGAMGSGTSWQPASGPMNMYHKQTGDWLLMFHYNLVTGVNSQGGPRGATKFESANWFMPMAYHKRHNQ